MAKAIKNSRVYPFAHFWSIDELERLFLKARAGDRIIYHIGLLANDRAYDPELAKQDLPPLRVRVAQFMCELGDYVLRIEAEGRADLGCRKLGEQAWEYSLTKRKTVGRGCDWEKFLDGRTRADEDGPRPVYDDDSLPPDSPRSKDWD